MASVKWLLHWWAGVLVCVRLWSFVVTHLWTWLWNNQRRRPSWHGVQGKLHLRPRPPAWRHITDPLSSAGQIPERRGERLQMSVSELCKGDLKCLLVLLQRRELSETDSMLSQCIWAWYKSIFPTKTLFTCGLSNVSSTTPNGTCCPYALLELPDWLWPACFLDCLAHTVTDMLKYVMFRATAILYPCRHGNTQGTCSVWRH